MNGDVDKRRLKVIRASVMGCYTLDVLLDEIVYFGGLPGIYRRGKLWRAHAVVASNWWHDGRTPLTALRGAVRAWVKAGAPSQGVSHG